MFSLKNYFLRSGNLVWRKFKISFGKKFETATLSFLSGDGAEILLRFGLTVVAFMGATTATDDNAEEAGLTGV
jgi:hypothetical protein